MTEPSSIAFESITKRFGAAVANNSISCEVKTGGIHSFLGENGAGKSTLMKILSGYYQPDSGRILLNGSPVVFHSPSDARKAGIGMVYQHFTLITSMTILDNILLGDSRTPFLLRRRSIEERVESEAKRLGFNFDFSSPVWKLSVSERQKVEIFKLMWRDAHILILDEPTSQLAPFEAEDILTVISNLARDGRIVMMVSHNMEEVLRFSSHVSVLRGGQCIATLDAQSARIQELASLMVGAIPVRSARPSGRQSSMPALGLRDVVVRLSPENRPLTDLSLDIYSGEVLGVAGVTGSGQDELAAILTGHLRPDSGSLLISGEESLWKLLQSTSSSSAHVPADPKNYGSVQRLSLLDNMFLRDINCRRFQRGPFLRHLVMRDEAEIRLKRFHVRPENPDLPCSALSGGNLQRLILAREFASQAGVMIAVNPTAGLDLAAARMVREALRTYASEGKAVVLISHDLTELLDVCDRIAVLCAGEITGIERSENLDSESLGLLMGGVKAEIVRALMKPQMGSSEDNNLDLRSALHQLLDSTNWWQRRLAAQIGLRLFVPEDFPKLHARLLEESHDETKVWMSLALARIGDETELEKLVCAFRKNPVGFLDAQRRLLRSEDYASMKKAVLNRLGNGVAHWESVLGLLVLKHLGAAPGDHLIGILKASNCAAVVHLAGQRSCEVKEGLQ